LKRRGEASFRGKAPKSLFDTLQHEEELVTESRMLVGFYPALSLFLSVSTPAFAQEAKNPTEFTPGILAERNVSVVLPSPLIVDERGRANGSY
jgi:hypothetical protein